MLTKTTTSSSFYTVIARFNSSFGPGNIQTQIASGNPQLASVRALHQLDHIKIQPAQD